LEVPARSSPDKANRFFENSHDAWHDACISFFRGRENHPITTEGDDRDTSEQLPHATSARPRHPQEEIMADEMKNNVKSGIDDAASTAKKGVDRVSGVNIRDTGHAVMDKASDYAHQAKEKIGEWAGEARDAVGDFTEHAGERAQKWAGQAYDMASENASYFGNEVMKLVRNHPLPALAIGFGLGLLVGRTARSI
jgi:hypothetical protein